MGCRCSLAPSFPSTPRVSTSVLEPMVQPWCKPDDEKNAPVQSWRRRMAEHLACKVGASTSWQRPRLVKRAWMKRWSSLWSCTAARALALSLLESRCAPGCDGAAPSTSEVVCDHRHALLSRGVGCVRMVLRFPTFFIRRPWLRTQLAQMHGSSMLSMMTSTWSDAEVTHLKVHSRQ